MRVFSFAEAAQIPRGDYYAAAIAPTSRHDKVLVDGQLAMPGFWVPGPFRGGEPLRTVRLLTTPESTSEYQPAEIWLAEDPCETRTGPFRSLESDGPLIVGTGSAVTLHGDFVAGFGTVRCSVWSEDEPASWAWSIRAYRFNRRHVGYPESYYLVTDRAVTVAVGTPTTDVVYVGGTNDAQRWDYLRIYSTHSAGAAARATIEAW